MNAIERLVSAGMDRDAAGEAVHWYLSQGDENKLERYICEYENRFLEKVGNDYA